MSGSMQILRQELPLTAEQAQLMDIVLRESERLNDTIRSVPRLRAAAARRRCAGSTSGGSLQRHGAAAAQQRRGAPTATSIDVDVPRRAGLVEADEAQIRQIVWNLATNGLRAMPRRRRAAAARRAAPASRRRRRRRARRCDDEGVGIPPRSSTASSSRSTAVRQRHRPRPGHRPPHRHRLRRRDRASARSRARARRVDGAAAAVGGRAPRTSGRRRRPGAAI